MQVNTTTPKVSIGIDAAVVAAHQIAIRGEIRDDFRVMPTLAGLADADRAARTVSGSDGCRRTHSGDVAEWRGDRVQLAHLGIPRAHASKRNGRIRVMYSSPIQFGQNIGECFGKKILPSSIGFNLLGFSRSLLSLGPSRFELTCLRVSRGRYWEHRTRRWGTAFGTASEALARRARRSLMAATVAARFGAHGRGRRWWMPSGPHWAAVHLSAGLGLNSIS